MMRTLGGAIASRVGTAVACGLVLGGLMVMSSREAVGETAPDRRIKADADVVAKELNEALCDAANQARQSLTTSMNRLFEDTLGQVLAEGCDLGTAERESVVGRLLRDLNIGAAIPVDPDLYVGAQAGPERDHYRAEVELSYGLDAANKRIIGLFDRDARLEACARKSRAFRQIEEDVAAAHRRKADLITGHLDSFDALVFPAGQNVVAKPNLGLRSSIAFALAKDDRFLRERDFSDIAFETYALSMRTGRRLQLLWSVLDVTGIIFDGQPDSDAIAARLRTLGGEGVVPLRRDHVLYDEACSLWSARGTGDKEIVLSIIDARKIEGKPAIPGACVIAGIGVYSGLRNITSLSPEELFVPYENTRIVSDTIVRALSFLHDFGIESGMSRLEARAHLTKEIAERQKRYERQQAPRYQEVFRMCPAR